MAGETELTALLAGLDPVLHPGELVWATVPAGAEVPAAADEAAFARIVEDEGTTVVVPAAVATRHDLVHEAPSRRIELKVRSDLAAVGLTAAVSTALAAEGISANVVAAFHHDHVLVPAADAEAAHATLRELTGPPTLRPATAADAEALCLFVGWAGEALGPRGDGADGVREIPKLRRYVDGFGHRPGDVGVVAIGPSGRAVGAAWVRLLIGEEADDTYVDDVTPELAIACRPSQRGRGLGDVLMAAVVEAAAAAGHPAVVLSVREGNPAHRLYARHGFATIGTVGNRVGGRSTQMLLRLPPPEPVIGSDG
jgi:ribosomal protein S18 acetylase RimI-like enzyme